MIEFFLSLLKIMHMQMHDCQKHLITCTVTLRTQIHLKYVDNVYKINHSFNSNMLIEYNHLVID